MIILLLPIGVREAPHGVQLIGDAWNYHIITENPSIILWSYLMRGLVNDGKTVVLDVSGVDCHGSDAELGHRPNLPAEPLRVGTDP